MKVSCLLLINLLCCFLCYSQNFISNGKKFCLNDGRTYLSFTFLAYENRSYVYVKQLGQDWEGLNINAACECDVVFNSNYELLIKNCRPEYNNTKKYMPFLEFNETFKFDKVQNYLKLNRNNKNIIFNSCD